ncbi:MAG: OmpA family protein [Oceanospirillaceae bacterium]|jgi:outer membrane protein OmpA-like peptidoglycan-associated protein|nr:OmpA family protein [Oceanospirillaceae bacterium]
MKLNKTVLGLTMALIVSPSWGHGEHGTNTVWRSGNGTAVLSGNGECVLAKDFASLDGHSCHAVKVEEVAVIEAPIDELPVAEAPVITIVEKVEPAAAEIVYAVETHHNIIHFDSDSSALTMQAKLTLKEMIEASRNAWQILAVQVIGHADTSGETEYNMVLSEQRVATVANYIAARGLRSTSNFAQGEALPVIENGEENKAASRRAELKIKVQVKVMN